MSEVIEAIEFRHGLAGWISARQSTATNNCWKWITVEFADKPAKEVELGEMVKAVGALRFAGFNSRADQIDELVSAMLVPPANQPELVIRHLTPRGAQTT